jgi:lipopolysaccharide/colanic/teichoic acid biosynthesis glycosyltransferase
LIDKMDRSVIAVHLVESLVMSVELFVPKTLESAKLDRLSEIGGGKAIGKGRNESAKLIEMEMPIARTTLLLVQPRAPRRLSPWSESAAKRLFDCGCVLLALPLVLPVLLLTALAVCLTSEGPVLFLQKRVGNHGRVFTIFKFRTLMHNSEAAYHAVTTADNQPFTPIGPFLRRWKLDELPQIANVLIGHMSLVGPRPKMPQHVTLTPPCRPGITGAATIAFAQEEKILDRIPKHHLETYYHTVVLPTKRRLDAEYMARATFASDLKIIIDSVLRRWDDFVASGLLEMEHSTMIERMSEREIEVAELVSMRVGVR